MQILFQGERQIDHVTEHSTAQQKLSREVFHLSKFYMLLNLQA